MGPWSQSIQHSSLETETAASWTYFTVAGRWGDGAGDERTAERATSEQRGGSGGAGSGTSSLTSPPSCHCQPNFGRRRRPIQPDGARKWKPDASSLVVELGVETKLSKTVDPDENAMDSLLV
jgi:hypothetical protein